MINIHINETSIKAKDKDTILMAANRYGIKIPNICYIEGLPPYGSCRLCVVEVENMQSLMPACSTLVKEGMKIKTHSPKALDARKKVVELLLANHPDDCNYCSKKNNCELQKLAFDLNIRERGDVPSEGEQSPIDDSSPSIVRDQNKCILCGKCVRICEEIQSVSAIDFVKRGSKTRIATAFDEGLNLSSCIYCGQCTKVCPTGALTERNDVQKVINVLNNPNLYPVIQHAPSVSVSLAEELGMKLGTDIDGKMVAALRQIGFKKVFDTSFTADLTIMEEGSELVDRIKNNGVLPMITSCSPGWIKFIEEFYPELLPNISTCKSPQQMMGAIIKTYFAEKQNLKPSQIFSVSVMPCTAKKFECERPEMSRTGVADVDVVLTTRELGQLIRTFGVDMGKIKPETADTPFGTRSTAGKIFGASGGVMEAALRSGYYLITGNELPNPMLKNLRGFSPIKKANIKIGNLTLGVAVTSGLGNARKLLEKVKKGNSGIHFIEIMTCQGGCINGGGQPYNLNPEAVKARMKRLYKIDSTEKLNKSHLNPDVKRIYDEFLDHPLSEESHELLHTHYGKREVLK